MPLENSRACCSDPRAVRTPSKASGRSPSATVAMAELPAPCTFRPDRMMKLTGCLAPSIQAKKRTRGRAAAVESLHQPEIEIKGEPATARLLPVPFELPVAGTTDSMPSQNQPMIDAFSLTVIQRWQLGERW